MLRIHTGKLGRNRSLATVKKVKTKAIQVSNRRGQLKANCITRNIIRVIAVRIVRLKSESVTPQMYIPIMETEKNPSKPNTPVIPKIDGRQRGSLTTERKYLLKLKKVRSGNRIKKDQKTCLAGVTCT